MDDDMHEYTVNFLIKSDGRKEIFNARKIEDAVARCFKALSCEPSRSHASPGAISGFVSAQILLDAHEGNDAHVDDVHNEVEQRLLTLGEVEVARAYMSYRAEKRRAKGRAIPVEVREAFESASKFFNSPLEEFQFFDKYSKWLEDLGRRETWPETVDRAVDFLTELAGPRFPASELARIKAAMLARDVMPSMRLLAMAGDAARRNNIALYNCAYQGIDHPYAFVETLLILMAGTGKGYSVERQFVDRLPVVGDGWNSCDSASLIGLHVGMEVCRSSWRFVVPDSTQGWAQALFHGLDVWWSGGDVEFDFSQIRPAGARLKTKGGTASGPEPLRRMLDYIRSVLLGAQGRKLSTLEVHDIQCMIADCVVSGGVRRSAMIALFDFSDHEMATCKAGAWHVSTPWRSNANNSAVMPDRELSQPEIVKFFMAMHSAGSGEPGLFSRANAVRMMPERRRSKLSAKALAEIGCNPCGEVVLLSFCNLSIAVARPGQTRAQLLEAVELAAIIGTIQSSATHFPGLRDKWRANCEAERLLGVDITGQMDCVTSQFESEPGGGYDRHEYSRSIYTPDGPRPESSPGIPSDVLEAAKSVAIEANQLLCQYVGEGIEPSAAVTTVKPGGNSSAFLGCSAGMSRRWSPFQIRRVAVSNHGPMIKVLRAAGVPIEAYKADTSQAVFPARAPSPDSPTTRDDCAIEQMEYWKRLKLCYTEHNPSVTITYRAHELLAVMQWLHENQSIIGGMSFLPADDHTYANAPNEAITEEEYDRRMAEFPVIDFSLLYGFEQHDQTTSSREFACTAGSCELV